MTELLQTQVDPQLKEDEFNKCDDHNEILSMKCKTCDLNICTECVSTDQHIGHQIKSLKFMIEEAKLKVLNAKDELNNYIEKLEKSKTDLK